MLKKSAAGIAVVLGLIASVLAVWQEWGLYPVGVIVLLAAVAVVSVAVAGQALLTGGADPATRQHDAEIVREIRALVPRQKIEWLRGWDFGGSWNAYNTNVLYELNRLDNVEHRAHDRRLRRALRRLFDSTAAFTLLLTEHSFRERNRIDDWRNVGWGGSEADSLEGAERALWGKRRTLLNTGAGPVVEAYDAFMETARRRHLLDAPSAG